MNPRREMLATVLLCAAAAALVIFAAGRVWATAVGADPPNPVMRTTGTEIGSPTAVLGWASLAALGAVFAVRGKARIAIGVILALLGLAIMIFAFRSAGPQPVLDAIQVRSPLFTVKDPQVVEFTSWMPLTVGMGALILLAGALVAVRGPRWPGMSARYEGKAAPVPAEQDDPGALWKSLDRGEDPTAGDRS